MIKKLLAVSAALLLIMTLIPFSVEATPKSNAVSPDWPDGTFHGTWHNRTASGSLQGTIDQGRRDTLGTFTADWTNNATTGHVTGFFCGSLFLGRWEGANQSSLLVGHVATNATGFTGLLILQGHGLVRITGQYQASFLPALTGPYHIGVQSIPLVDPNRPEYFTADPTDVREFMVQLWYPRDPNASGPQDPYMDPLTFLWLKNQSPVPLITIPDTAYRFVHPHGQLNSQVAAGLHPVLVFSPGYDGVYQIYTSLIEDLASHGFVVAAINHPYVSGITVFPDGHTVDIATPPTDPVERAAFMNMSLRTIIGDAKFTLDFLTTLNATNSTFGGTLDLGRVGMLGHSFGGANTAVCCLEDARFKAGLTLDGYFDTGFLNGTISQPFLLMVQEARFANDSNTMFVWNHTTGDVFKVGITGSTHYAFTDVGTLLSHLVPLIPPRLLGFGTIAPKRMVNVTRAYEVTFFEVYLDGRPVQDLIDLSATFPEVMVDYRLA